MTKVKKRKPLFTAMLLVLALSLQACSGGNNGGAAQPEASSGAAATNSTSSAEPASGTDALKPYEVSIIYFGAPQRDDAVVEAKLSEYFKEKFNATVDLQPIASSEYKQKTELMLNAGEPMDLVFTASWLNFFGNVAKGAFLDLDDLLAKYGQGITENLNPIYLEAPRYKGKLYGIPTNKEITQGKAYTYRKDIIDKYNIPIEDIKTMSDFEPWFKLLKEKEPELILDFIKESGEGMMYETRSNFRAIGPTPNKIPLFLYDYTNTDNIQIKSVIDPEISAIAKAEYELNRSYYEKGYINSDAATTTTEIGDLRKQGKIWMQQAVWKPGADIELKIASDNKYDFVSKVIEEPIVTTDLAAGSMFSISRTSKDPERAMMVLNALHTDPYAVNLFVNGIEGTHYKKVGENRIEPIVDSGYGSTALFWVIGNQLLNYLKPGQPDDLYTSWKTFNDEAKRSPLLGFVFDETPVKNEITQLTSVIGEYRAASTGAIPDPAKMLEERNEKLKKAGIEKVKTELQTQIDAWKAAQ